MREEDEAKEVSKQPTIMETMERGTKVDPKSDLQKNFDRLLMELVGTNFLAFSFINSPEFYNFFCIPQQNIQYHDRPCLQEGHEQLCKGHHVQGDPAIDRFLRCVDNGHYRYMVMAHSRLLYLAHFSLCG